MTPGAAAVILVAALVATLGLWWFRLVMKSVRTLPKPTRYGVYALIWLAYFILTVIVAGRGG